MNTLQVNLPAMDNHEREIKAKSAKGMLWIGIISMIMLFAALTSAYIVRQAEGQWNEFELPLAFWISTAIILASSGTMHWAFRSAKQNKLKNVTIGVGLTLALGILFVVSQFMGWSDLVADKVYFAGKFSNASGSFLYAITGLHLVHLAGGLIYLMVTLSRSMKGKFNPKNYLGIQLCSIYWHFLDGLWIYLFLFLLFIR